MRTIQKLIILAAAMLVVLPTRAQELSSDKKDVGEIPINYTLSPSGAITYQMPIDVHPDPEKFQPEISLTYNSQQGESALGYGWNIGGLSAITHVSGNIYYDGKVTPLSVMEDKLMLDGTRLIKTGTDSWQAEQGFVKLKKLTSDALEARYPNGNTVMFETSVQTPFSYVQTNCRNRKGRNMKYVYTQAGNLSYLQKIMYGETEGAFNDSIVFSYRNATSGAIRYADGKSVRNSKLLEKVESYYRGELWRRYLLTYEKREVDHLVRIDCQTETRALNPLQFKYGDVRSIEYFNVRTIHLPKYFENSKSGGYDCLALSRGRFDWSSNSDGLISYPQESTYALLKWSNKDAQYGSRYDENQELLIYKNLSETPPTPVSFTAGKGFQRLIAVDVNGSGTDVPVKVNYYAEGVFPFSGRHKEKLVVAVYNRNMSSDIHKDYTYESSECVIDGSLASPRQREFLFGDFNGDGKTELLAISSCRNHVNRNSKTSSYALLVDLDKQTTLFEGSCFDYAFFQQMMEDTSPDRLIPLDYNGDGKTDICLINHDGTFVYEFTGNGFRQLAYVSAANGIGSSRFNFEDSELLVADLNGDGNMDLVLTPRDSHYGTSEAGENDMLRDERTRWRFLLSMGNSAYRGGEDGFAVSSRKYLRQYFETGGQNFMLVDVDSDGLPDLLRNVCGKIDVYLNKAGQLDSMPSDRATAQHANKLAQFAIANVTQSYFWAGGLICVDNGNIHSYDYTHKENRERMLHEMTDSYGLVTKHYYTDIMNASKNRYETKDMEEVPRSSYPYVTIAPHHYVGIWAEKYDGKTQVASADYKYTNAVFHLTGLGVRGFKKIETTDYLNHRKVTSFMDPALCGAEVRRETPTDTIVRNYVLDVNPNKTALLKLQKEAMTNTLDKTAFTAEYTYNNYGQAIRSIMRKGLNNVEDVRTSYINVDNAENYLLGLHDFSSMETALYDSTSVQNDEIIYDSRYLPIRKVTYATPGIVTEELFTYDENQRLLKQKQRAYEAEEYLIKTYSYDAEGRLTRETDAMGLNTDYSYDQETGLLQSITDHKGRTTRNEYDEWGNLITVRYPDEHAKQTSLVWTEENEPGLFVATTAETGKPTVKTYYDRMKREIRSAQIRFDGKVMKTDKAYNIKTGLLERISLPTTDSLPSQWSHYHYDRFDRQTSIRYASGKVDSCAYGALTDTIIENGIMHVREFDEAGMMTRATDAAGSIDYYYRPDGQPLVVVAPGKVETRFYYDGYNRRTAIKDPSAGIRRTDYDPAGSVCKETDADGKEILKTYDLYGRIISQTTPDIHTTYMYDDTENLLLSAVSDNGTALRYTYDAYGRMKIQREEAPDGKWLQKEYAYTTDGLPASISYSSQEGALTTELLTYVNGYLTEVRLADGTLVYRHDEENALGQLTKLSTGGMQRNYEFNGWGLPARRTITRADESIVFDHSYAFNIENNNLESRTDETRGLTETFGYDFLNRLSIYGSQQVTYDDSGNILSKDDAGELVYTNPNRPYAVTGFDPVAGKQAITGLNITYTAAQRPSVLTQGTKRVVLMYNANHDRTRMQVFDENTEVLTRYYLGGNYERDTDSTGTQERLYLGGSYYDAPGVLVKQNGQCQVYYIHRDYLGSILQIVDVHGNVVEENSFDAWGCRRNPATQTVYANGTAPKLMLGRGYTGHEHLAAFGLINMNARLYDPILGRFLSPDPYVQSPDFTQAFNRYSYCMNSPLCYVDENGEFIFTPILGPLGAALDAVCWGAVIGAGVSAATYSVATLTSGQTWNSSNFWKSVGVGAVGGAIGGAFGYMGSTGSLGAFGNSFGYNMLSGISNTLATNVIFGYDTNWTDILAMTAGSAIGASIPTFGGVKGGSLRNGLAEIGYNSARGAATGLASGLVNSAVNRDPNLIWQGMVGGAVGGAGRSLFMNLAFGAPYQSVTTYTDENGNKTLIPALHRNGGLLNMMLGGDVTLGRNATAYSPSSAKHESMHVKQQMERGWANFYGETIIQYFKAFVKYGDWTKVYDTPRTFEYEANTKFDNIMIK